LKKIGGINEKIYYIVIALFIYCITLFYDN